MIKLLSPLLGLLTSVPWYMWAIGLTSALAMCNGHRYKGVREEFDDAKRDAILQRKSDELTAANETSRRKNIQTEISDGANRKVIVLRSNLATSNLIAEQLRQQLETVQRSGCSGDTSTAKSGGAPGQTSDLPTDVSRRLDEASDGIAGYAEEAAIAGEACAASYRSLNQSDRK